MSSRAAPPPDDEYVDELIRQGIARFAAGNRREAHDLWRQAAALRPDDEDIWESLLSVVKTLEDRYVCLKNIVAINPDNQRATQQLRSIEPMVKDARRQKNIAFSLSRQRPKRLLYRMLMMLQGIKLLVLFIAVLIVLALGIMVGMILQ